jgi:hypothetical protein
VSAKDPGAATGVIPTEPGLCTCGHLEPVHNINISGQRTGCSTWTCSCKKYEAVITCARCETAAVGPCCSSHNAMLCHGCYRRTHFVELCVPGCPDCASGGLDPEAAVS